jgi:hypothetical protein
MALAGHACLGTLCAVKDALAHVVRPDGLDSQPFDSWSVDPNGVRPSQRCQRNAALMPWPLFGT